MELAGIGLSRRFFREGRNTNFFYAVEKTDFALPEGKLTVLIGRSGSGKTTFAHLLSGLLTPTEGNVLLDGNDLYAMGDAQRSRLRNRYLGIVPQGHTGLRSLTVLENVLAPAAMYNSAAGKEKHSQAMELLALVGIAPLADVYSGELSGGELRRMSIARALINDPQVIIADEPTGDLDGEATGAVLQLLRHCADRSVSVLLVTHEPEALAYADHVFRMEKGVLVPV